MAATVIVNNLTVVHTVSNSRLEAVPNASFVPDGHDWREYGSRSEEIEACS